MKKLRTSQFSSLSIFLFNLLCDNYNSCAIILFRMKAAILVCLVSLCLAQKTAKLPSTNNGELRQILSTREGATEFVQCVIFPKNCRDPRAQDIASEWGGGGIGWRINTGGKMMKVRKKLENKEKSNNFMSQSQKREEGRCGKVDREKRRKVEIVVS